MIQNNGKDKEIKDAAYPTKKSAHKIIHDQNAGIKQSNWNKKTIPFKNKRSSKGKLFIKITITFWNLIHKKLLHNPSKFSHIGRLTIPHCYFAPFNFQ